MAPRLRGDDRTSLELFFIRHSRESGNPVKAFMLVGIGVPNN
jgi:hypothetical protein